MNNNYFDEIYKDFFTVKKESIISEDKNSNDELIDIDSIYIDNESKNLLKQILEYMEKYSKDEEKNYINFNIIYEGNNDDNYDKIIKVLSKKNNDCNYTDILKSKTLSLYELNNKVDLNEIYNNHGIILIKDLSSILMQDENNKKMFFFNLINNLHKKKITILCGSKDELELFISFNKEIGKYFNFRINEIMPSIQEIYNDILNKIKMDNMNVLLLDYITNTYKEIDNYPRYRDNLISYLSFHKDVPKIREVKSIEEVFKELDELVGLEDIKKLLHDLVNLISLKKRSDLNIASVNLHMLFLGNPGTGKTTVARLLANILYNLGYIKENKLLEVSSKDLVAEYVGQTAIKTHAVVERAQGGVLFIDEAYSLSSKNNSYNDEAIATLIKDMEDNRDNLVVIFAGYTKEMQDFIDSNSGIASRIGYTLEFKDYTTEELLEIFKLMVTKAGFKITDEAIKKVHSIIEKERHVKNFGNARFIRNMYEKTVVLHATNTKDNKKKSKLITITDKDIASL